MSDEKELLENTVREDVVESTSMTDWANEPSISDLKQNLDDAQSDQDSHKADVDRWLENRAAARLTNVGSSNVVPKLIRKQNEWRYSSLSDPFLSTPDLFDVNPTTAGDVKRARQNGLILNKQINTQMNKTKFFDDYVREVVDIGTVFVKVGWASEEEEITRQVPQFEYQEDKMGQLGEYYTQLLQLRAQDAEGYADVQTAGLDHALDMFQETGISVHVKKVGVKPVTKVEETKNQPTLEIIPSINVIIDPSCAGDMDKAIFIGEKHKSSLAELKRDGKYTNLDQINATSAIDPTLDPDFEASADQEAFTFKDNTRKQFVVYTYWGEWDIHGDGTTRQIVASWVDDVCIRKELNPFPDRKLPFVQAVYMPVRESVFGEPDAELLKDNQDIVGAVLRGAIDLMAKSANSQTGRAKGWLDVTNKRKYDNGEDYEFNPSVDPRSGVYQHVYPELPNSAMNMIALQNTEAESLTGVKGYNSGVNAASLGDVASNARSALDAAARRELGILRRLADGVIQIGRKMIAMNAEWLADTEVVRITDEKFVEVRRDDLPGNFDLRLSISTADEDESKARELAFMLQTGGPTMDLAFVKMILAKIARLRKMPALAEQIEKYQPEPSPIEQAKAQKELEYLDAQIQKELALAQKHLAEAAASGGRGYKDQMQGELNAEKAGEAGGKARKHHSEADAIDQDFLSKATGTAHQEALDLQNNADKNKFLIEGAKSKTSESAE